MFERFSRKRSTSDAPATDGADSAATNEVGNGTGAETRDGASRAEPADATGRAEAGNGTGRTAVMDRPATEGRTAKRPFVARERGAPATAADARAIQREQHGGADGAAIFFGWLSALGLAVLCLAVVAAAGESLRLATGVSTNDAKDNAGTIGIVGAAILVLILVVAYYAGGYVAGRMARFDGPRQGLRVWLLGLFVTILAAVAGWVGGSQYNVFHQLNLPRIPVKEGDIATGAIITLAVVLVGTLVAAIAGGRAGERYHWRVDETGWNARRGV
jgi:hypothetical protein